MFINNAVASDYNFKINYGTVNHDSVATSDASTVKFDNKDEGYKVSLSRYINDFFGVEAIYYDLGESSIQGNKDDLFTHKEIDYTVKRLKELFI